MTTTQIELNEDTWTKLTTVADFTIQNTSNIAIKVVFTDGTPDDANNDGFSIVSGMGMQSGISVIGTAWGKSARDIAEVTVLE